jgi:hypothetical protein
MKLAYLFCLIILASCKSNENKEAVIAVDTVKTSVSRKEYTCPMHPEIVSDTPATCPRCGMDLEIKS